MKSITTISFIIIAYNEEHTIGRCLDAILAQNNLVDYEIVIIDDGSKDATARVVEGYKKNNLNIILHQLIPNQGRGAARAAGVDRARGKYFAFIDADIILPNHWLSTCLSYMDQYDAVGGIAVPDGDVNYIYTTFNLDPKVASQSTVVTGNNGFYKKKVFKDYNFDVSLRDGEDVAFNHQMISGNFSIFSINSLVVAHKETKTFFRSIHWLYQSGVGASRGLKQFKKIRLPDLAYFGFVAVFIASLLSVFFLGSSIFLIIPILCILATSVLHLKNKFIFHPRYAFNYMGAALINSILIACYYVGRTIGIFAIRNSLGSTNNR